MVWSPPASPPGSTVTGALTVLSVFTTRADGNARWICSPGESLFGTDSVAGKPREKSSGLEMSTSGLPARCASPASRSASNATAPAVALTTSSPWAAASAKVPTRASGPASASHVRSGRAVGRAP